MEKKDFLDFSPVRYFDKATNANLKDGEIGLITAKKGLGKTSILVQFGIDTLLNDKGLIHVSFDQHSSNVISWYSSIIAEVAKKKSISSLAEFTDEIVKNRTILNFNQENFTLPKVVSTIKAMKAGGIKVDSIIVDGLDLEVTPAEDLSCLAAFIKEEKMTAWFSMTSDSEELKTTLPADKLENFTTVAHLSSVGKGLALTVLKNGEGKVPLDTKTLLMSK